jgi:hypothetical protein
MSKTPFALETFKKRKSKHQKTHLLLKRSQNAFSGQKRVTDLFGWVCSGDCASLLSIIVHYYLWV